MSDIKKIDEQPIADSTELTKAEDTSANVNVSDIKGEQTSDSTERTLVEEKTTAKEEKTFVEETPDVENVPVGEETPVVEETPATEDAPVIEENIVPEENSVEEETIAEEEMPATEENTSYVIYETVEDVLARLKELAENEDEVSRQERDHLKASFYKIHKQNAEEEYKKFLENGGNPEEYVPTTDNNEAVLKELIALINQKRAKSAEAEKEEREANYLKKLQIIEKIKAILEKPDEVNRVYNDFRALQQEWNDIKLVPQEKATDLWKTYQLYVERFYDTLKLNNEFRAYDFKKNLELKTALCEKAEALADMEDVVAASRQLQQLHQDFREIGPVEKELREELWNRFKAASTVVNKKHQDFFEERKAKEQENLDKKTEICEKIEAIDTETLKTFADWNAKTDEIIELQKEWRTIGFAPQKMNVKIFERFRGACDAFFNKKAEFIKNVHESLNTNYQQKLELCEKVEELKESTEWKKTTDAIIALQKKWKEIGTVPKKYSDEIWKRFNAACDAFFEAKKQANESVYNEQNDNLEKKQELIDKLVKIDPETAEEDIRPILKQAQEDWNNIGHVPFKKKEAIYKAFREQMDRLYGALHESASRRRINRFKQEVKDTDGRIKDKLNRQRDILTNEIKTYENNLGFLSFSAKSKNGSALVEDINRKIEKLKAELKEVTEKIKALNE